MERKCVPLESGYCSNLPYNITTYPNMLGHKTIEEAAAMKVRCSVFNLSAEVRVYKELASRTGGLHTVILDDLHLRDMLSQHLDPPASATDLAASLVKMGFPSHAGRLRDETGEGLGLCQCCLDKTEEAGSCRISTAGKEN